MSSRSIQKPQLKEQEEEERPTGTTSPLEVCEEVVGEVEPAGGDNGAAGEMFFDPDAEIEEDRATVPEA